MDYNDIFKAFGFEDTEDIARNCPSMPVMNTCPVKERSPVHVEQAHHEFPQISDAAYARATMEGPF